ncbi:hypothetical protein [Streptomyces sp. PSKA30]|uniref:hypothetical protein n=1 Tax=Streptomyces sp. PSKA30 TaxID=2874597 RepID=UPI001CD10914|nr:hypothetical protein [Streptomyces sp. PSKA30]MBZ9644453.1 hypothetical protein [Streptomyces sp. PSKA30]
MSKGRKKNVGRFDGQQVLSLATVLAVFALVTALVLIGYEPGVATTAVAAAGLTASELVRRVFARGRRSEPRTPQSHGAEDQ